MRIGIMSLNYESYVCDYMFSGSWMVNRIPNCQPGTSSVDLKVDAKQIRFTPVA